MPLLVARVQATDDSNFYTNKDLSKKKAKTAKSRLTDDQFP